MLLLILALVTVGVCALYLAPRMHTPAVHTPELTPDPFESTLGHHVDVRL